MLAFPARPARSPRPLAAPLALAALLLAAAPLDAQTVYGAAGLAPANVQAAVDAYRADLGALVPDNNTVGGFGGVGRREINWEGVGAAALSPNPFPGDFFNLPQAGRARGSVYSTPGTHFEVNPNAGGPIAEFSNIDPSYPDDFAPFSGQKMFTAVGSNVVDVTFFLPGTNVAGLTRGFGSLFTDVDLDNTTSIEYFGLNGNSLGTWYVPAIVGSNTQSFLGVRFDDAVVHRVRITSGNAALGAGVVDQDGAPVDLVVMDDFIYAEVAAVPEPSTWALLATGLAGVVAAARRRRAPRA